MWLASHKDACKHGRSGIVPSMFPSGQAHSDTFDDTNDKPTTDAVEDGKSDNNGDVDDDASAVDVFVSEVSSLPLERCMRFVPHDQNTGAFFVAVFHKISQLPGQYLLNYGLFFIYIPLPTIVVSSVHSGSYSE